MNPRRTGRKPTARSLRAAQFPGLRTNAYSKPIEELARSVGIKEKLAAMEKLRFCGRDGSMLSGDVCLEIAHRQRAEVAEKLGWLNKAHRHWSDVVASGERQGLSLDMVGGLALMQLAHIPMYSWRLAYDTLPPPHITTATYNQLIGVAESHSQAYWRGQNLLQDTSGLVGNMAELSVLLLAHRFGLRELGDQSWAAQPSLQSQNRFIQGSEPLENPRWDVSIFTDRGKPELSYKAQIKSSTYADAQRFSLLPPDVTKVVVNPDLVLDEQDNRAFFPTTIISECITESNANSARLTDRLNRRTELLLDRLG
jgi:hypothetical protein